ncbi:hypothetical protein APH_0031 [Anaplasma phagocytophilum str. HZ]|uniref:Uncharacterized protein n=1 Tax=Anaplasma phagocytophilum (strain HZ) TaxID=212042 RepID=Q2GLT5_ANAPZ|nr:hypothetical protein APH_0031 [Anaplasma phagocytophilum str. HZ]KJV60623.1 hypothetical protein APHWEB_0497 [Anaplasma phagocytophilum str. Webster]
MREKRILKRTAGILHDKHSTAFILNYLDMTELFVAYLE